LRVSELVGLQLADLTLSAQATVHVMGKGRRERILPLWKETASVLRDWLKARGEPRGSRTPLFQNARGELMTRSGFKYILAKHVRAASAKQPSLTKNGFRRTLSVTRAPCTPCTLRETYGRWHCGSDTRVSKARKSTCARIRPRSWRPWPRSFHPTFGEVNSGRQTSCWPCCDPNSRLLNYVPSAVSATA
jgi:integrase